MAVSLPSIARGFHASFAEIEWVVSAYMTAFAACLLPAGGLADRFGRKRMLAAGLALFALASLGCGLAPSAAWLIAARAVKGGGAAMLLTAALAVIANRFPDGRERARAWAIWGMCMGIATALAPLIGGAITQWIGWRWVFLLNLPACALLAAGVRAAIAESRDPHATRVDAPGSLLFGAALACAIAALIGAPSHGWLTGATLGRLGLAAALSTAFVAVERRHARPMVDLALFGQPRFVGAVVAMFGYAACAQVMMTFLPLYLQNAFGMSAIDAGLGMLPFALAMIVGPSLGAKLAARMSSGGVQDTALPYRQLAAFLPGEGVGGAGLHWSGVHFRITPEELRLRSHYEERYGKKFIPDGMTIQDTGVSYDELEPYFDFAEKVFGTSGQAYQVGGKVVGDGNVFEANRSDHFPLPAQLNTYSAQRFFDAAKSLGLHPYRLPSANTSGPYTNPYGVQMGPCNFCGYCSGYACYMYSKASPNLNILPALRQTPNFELRSKCHVLRVDLDDTKKRATGVTYVDPAGREIHQPADLVIVAAFQYHNVHLLLLSGIGKPYDPISGEGVVGRNFAYQNLSTIKAYFDKDTYTNPFVGAGGNGVAVDDFNADNFDHGPLGFVGGSPLWVNQAGVKPVSGIATPPGTPQWGSAWKKAVKDSYAHTISMDAHGTNMSYRDVYLDLDPTYRDSYGQPLLRMTFDWKDNDIRMAQYVTAQMKKIAEAMGPKAIGVSTREFGKHFDTRAYQTTHLVGGAIMGTDPKTSVLNRYLQCWDVHNVFVMGASALPQGIGYNPTGIVAALAYWSARAIREQYLKNPAPLVTA
ncbi:TPA: MFS transporter [Burkholderia vietnamiensis]|nr:MFS transporter [Burkholderia vietnamiensis]